MQVTYEELRQVEALSDLPDEHLQWILDHSEYMEYKDGENVAQYGQPSETMFILLSGKVSFYMYLNGRQVYFFTFENNDLSGGVGGLLPYSRMKTYPGNSYAIVDVRMLRLHKSHFQELEHLNPDFIQRLIGYMTTRARHFATTQLQHEKVSALGNLAAGIAHELNNPAAAIKGISDELAKRLDRNYVLTKNILACNLTMQNMRNIHELVEEKVNKPTPVIKRSTMELLENEEEISDWLQKNGVTQREAAETFSECGFSMEELEKLSDGIDQSAFGCVIPWLENLIASQKIINDLAEASSRISNLVGSIKSHVHMDRTKDLQPTNLHRDIENTLTLLGFKLREKNIEVVRTFHPDLPEVPAFVTELNQVWTNLIDNAIFAMEKNGKLIIETCLNSKEVTVKIIDNGPGIPPDIMSRIFEPFFTTKKVGEGTGIGLDLVSRIIKGHEGTINVRSVPGRTEFSVCLPLQQKQEPK